MIGEVSRLLRGPYVLVPVTLAVAVLLVTAGQAVFAGSNQTISGCYYEDGAGFLKIVNGPARCRNNEVAVTQNKTAPRGPEGMKGPKGETGDRRPAGLRGATGARGPEGKPPSFAFAQAADSVSTSNTNSYQDLGRPTVTVNVPASRFISR